MILNIVTSNFFTISDASNKGSSREGELHFADKSVKTPTFMPVGTAGTVKTLTADLVRSTSVGIVLGNTYHLHLAPGEVAVRKEGGLAAYSKWNGPMLTDSGGFQVFSLGKIRKITDEGVKFQNPINGDKIFITPEKSMQIQHDLGADIIMAFDDVVSLSDERERTLEAMERTHAWLERCIKEHEKLSKGKKNPPKLFGIVQGGLDKKLRKMSWDYVKNTEVDGIAIGGLSVGESRREMHEMLDYLSTIYGKDDRPRYLMGVGHPIDMRYAIERGIDMFDCVLPTRNGRHGTYWAEIDGEDTQLSIKKADFADDTSVLEKNCDCYTCLNGYSKAYIRHLAKSGESVAGSLLSVHNIRYLQRICEGYQ